MHHRSLQALLWRQRELGRLDSNVLRLRLASVTPNEAFTIRRMGAIIADAAVKRGTVHARDFAREGIDQATAERLFGKALARARAIEPAVDAIAAAA